MAIYIVSHLLHLLRGHNTNRRRGFQKDAPRLAIDGLMHPTLASSSTVYWQPLSSGTLLSMPSGMAFLDLFFLSLLLELFLRISKLILLRSKEFRYNITAAAWRWRTAPVTERTWLSTAEADRVCFNSLAFLPFWPTKGVPGDIIAVSVASIEPLFTVLVEQTTASSLLTTWSSPHSFTILLFRLRLRELCRSDAAPL